MNSSKTKILFVTIILLSFNCYAFTRTYIDGEREHCYDFIEDVAANKKKISLNEINKVLGNSTNSIAYTHTYHWRAIEVTFLNGKYLFHIGQEFSLKESDLEYHLITPDFIIKIFGKPLRISQSIMTIKEWWCSNSSSHLSVVLHNDETDEIVKYYGKYCNPRNGFLCYSFEFSSQSK